MSGGSMGHFYQSIEDVAHAMNKDATVAQDHLRVAFATHLKAVAYALHDIEWVDSGDREPGSERDAIIKCLGVDGHLKHLGRFGLVKLWQESHFNLADQQETPSWHCLVKFPQNDGLNGSAYTPEEERHTQVSGAVNSVLKILREHFIHAKGPT